MTNKQPCTQIVADSLAAHSGKSDRREWHTVGAWLHPGERIVIVRADDAALDEPEQCEPLSPNLGGDAMTDHITLPRAVVDGALACLVEECIGDVFYAETVAALRAALAEPETQKQSEEYLDMVKANRCWSLQSAAYLALDALRGGNHRDAFVILYEELSKPGRPEPRPVTGKDSLQVAKPQRRQHRGWKCPINHFGCTRNCGNYGCGN